MKNILRRAICVLGIMLFSLGVGFTALAEQPTVYEPILKGEEITVNGSLPDGYGGQDVTIQIIRPGGTLGDPESIWYIRELKSNDDGTFSLTVLMKNDVSGIYTIYAGSKNLSPSGLTPRPDSDGYIETFYYVSKKARDEFVDKINEATSVETIMALIEDEAMQPTIRNIGLFIDSYESLSESRKQEVAKALLNGVYNEDEMYKTFNDALIVVILNSSTNAENTFENMRAFSDYLHIDYTQYDERKSNEKVQDFLDKYIAAKKGSGWKSTEDFVNGLEDIWLLADINSETSYKNIWDIIEKNIEYFNFDSEDLSYYKSLTNEADIYSVNKALTNKNFMSKEEVEEAFKNSVQALRNSKNNTGAGSGTANSGGGGGSSATSANVGFPAIVAPPVNDPVQDTSNAFFSDVPTTHWAYNDILKLSERGIVNGNGAGAFEPEKTLTREIFVTMLARGLQLSAESEAAPFTDVSESDWFNAYVSSAAKARIVRGFDDGTFGVGQEITRQDMAAMIYRSAKYLGIDMADEDADTMFTDDADIALYAREAIYSLKNMNILNGMDDGSYSPHGLSTKAQAAACICRMLGL